MTSERKEEEVDSFVREMMYPALSVLCGRGDPPTVVVRSLAFNGVKAEPLSGLVEVKKGK